MPVASSMVHPTSPASAASRIFSATISGASPPPLFRSAETCESVASTIKRACASASSRVSPPSFRPRAEAEAALDVAKAGSQGPRECRRSRRPRDSELRRRQGRCGGHGSEFFLGDTHRSDLAIGSPLCYSLSHTDGLSQTLPRGQAIAAAESDRTASLVGRKICSSSFLPSRSLRSFVASSGFRPCWVRAKPRCRRPRPVGA